MWHLPEPGLEPVSPALAGGFLTTVSPGKPLIAFKYMYILWIKTVSRAVIAPLLPSHCGFSFFFGCGVSFLVTSSVFLLMTVQQLLVILVFSQEGVRACPSTLPSWFRLCLICILNFTLQLLFCIADVHLYLLIYLPLPVLFLPFYISIFLSKIVFLQYFF